MLLWKTEWWQEGKERKAAMKQVGIGEGLQESKKSLWPMLFVLRVTTGPEIRGTLVCRN